MFRPSTPSALCAFRDPIELITSVTGPDSAMAGAKHLIHDRDAKYSPGFDKIFKSVGIKPVILPPSSPNLNAFAERWVRSVKRECLDQMILFGEKSLKHVLDEYVAQLSRRTSAPGNRQRHPLSLRRSRAQDRTGQKARATRRIAEFQPSRRRLTSGRSPVRRTSGPSQLRNRVRILCFCFPSARSHSSFTPVRIALPMIDAFYIACFHSETPHFQSDEFFDHTALRWRDSNYTFRKSNSSLWLFT